ncbi:MAG: hypothetical protein AAGG69_16440 [Pseudomonadota bacterium]
MRLTVLLALAALIGATVGVSASNERPVDRAATDCEAYAQFAMEQQWQNEVSQCGLTGERWHTNRASHRTWCFFASERDRAAHYLDRDRDLRVCINERKRREAETITVIPEPNTGVTGQPVARGIDANWCNNFAHDMFDLAVNYANNGCSLAGNPTWNTYYNQCMTVTRPQINEIHNSIMAEGNACIARKP